MTKITPIAEVQRRIRPLPPQHKAAFLRAVIACEPMRGVRRHELELMLKEVVNADLRKSNREDRRAS